MSKIELKWEVSEDGKKTIISDEMDAKILINEETKEVHNVKAMFREIIYKSFLNEWKKNVVLIVNKDIEVKEVNLIIKDIIDTCNHELKQKK